MIAADYQKIFYILLPTGPLWPEQDGDSPNWDMLASALSLELARIDEQALELVDEAIPDATSYTYPVELLEAWERVAGLPDQYTPTGQTITQRIQALIAKLRGPGAPTLAKIENIVEPYSIDYAVFDGYRLVDSFAQSVGGAQWWYGGGATVVENAAPDRHGNMTAEVITFPTTSGFVYSNILRIAAYESIFIDFWIRLSSGGSHLLEIKVTGRDGTTAVYTDNVALNTTWAHHTIRIADVGTGAYDPRLRLRITSGSNVVLHIAEVKGGWRERYYPVFMAGSVAGESVGSIWEHVYGVEYGEDLISRDGGTGKIIWGTQMTLTEDAVTEPISRQQIAYKFDPPYSSFCIAIFYLTTYTRYVRYSFWVRTDTTGYLTIRAYGCENGALVYTRLLIPMRESWEFIEFDVDNGIGITYPTYPEVRITVVDGIVNLYLAHARASETSVEIEGRVSEASPLHTLPMFHSYGELTQCTE